MEKRKLSRIDATFSSEITIQLQFSSHVDQIYRINDYNSVGISIQTPDIELFINNSVKSLFLYYGSRLIGHVVDPKIFRISKSENKVVFLLNNKKITDFFEREIRIDVRPSLVGAISARDPVKFNTILHFSIDEISQGGVGVSTSKSNRHLLPGTKIDKAKVYLPCIGFIESCSLTIAYVEIEEERMNLGLKFNNLSEKEKLLVINFMLLNANSENEQNLLKKRKHKFCQAIRVERVSSPDQFRKVASVRYKAYRNANKVADNATECSMLDQYDESSIVLIASVGTKPVGTIRLVFGEIGKVFPFEEYFDYSVVGDFKRNQITEVSRLAVDPSYQGTDVLLRLFQEFAIEAMTKECIASVCMATKKLAPYYQSIGSKKISVEVNHPYLKDETLAMYLFEQKRFSSGKMSAMAWFGFAKDTLSHLHEFSFVKGVRRDLLKYPMFCIELLTVWIKKLFKN